MADGLLESLKRTRPSYNGERDWHRFLLDSYTGAGGYEGKVRQPAAGWWGAAGDHYTPSALSGSTSDVGLSAESYLDRYTREDPAKFEARRALAHVWNFVGPLTDLKLSYLLRKGFAYADQPTELSDWREDVDGLGTTWDEMRPMVALAAAIWGWTPVLIDQDPAIEGESVAQASERGAGRPRAIPLTPANLVDYDHDGNGFRWAKIRTDHVERSEWNSKPTQVSVFRIWTPNTVTTYEVRAEEGKDEAVGPPVESPHPFGQVPLVIFRHAAAVGEPVMGLPMHAAPALAQRRLFNLLSELDEHMRSQVFAVLVLAMKNGEGGEVTLGVDNALPLDQEAKQKHYYISPDPGIAEVYERRIEATIREGIYRPARAEYSRPTGAAVSGVARAYEFSSTNRAIADFAGELARGEEWMDSIVWAGMGKDPAALDKYSVTPPADFGVEDLSSEIENTVTALTVDMGATMKKRLTLRLAERMDPQMPPDIRKVVEAELDEVQAQADADAAMMRAMRAAPPEPDPNGDPPPPPPPPPPRGPPAPWGPAVAMDPTIAFMSGSIFGAVVTLAVLSALAWLGRDQ